MITTKNYYFMRKLHNHCSTDSYQASPTRGVRGHS